MPWIAYKVTFRLLSPLHIGAGKMGNVQRTRPYVAGRNLWGALTARVARDDHTTGAPHPQAYRDLGRSLPDKLTFTYFYPTTDPEGDSPLFPDLDSQGRLSYGKNGPCSMSASAFRYRFLSTFTGTALEPSAHSAAEASLHEVECLAPYTRDEGKSVYLTGYLFQAESASLRWKDALGRIQIGGERGYGWGRLQPAGKPILCDGKSLFGGPISARSDSWPPVLEAPAGSCLLAHALASDFHERKAVRGVAGPVEPLVGRETGLDSRFGLHLSEARICYPPGSRLVEDSVFRIGRYGIWEGIPGAGRRAV